MVIWHIIFWAVLTIALVCAEIGTVQMIAIWFGAGSLAAFVSAFFGISFQLQIIIFITVSIILLILTRPIVKKYTKGKHIATNADSIIGKTCVVIEKIDNLRNTGRVHVNGLDWTARAQEDTDTFEVDSVCVVVDIQGVKAIVKPVA
ncbi:NfeD family protein [Paludicola sp. MB14-C6]|uniref:NfeD family protein n=1 Tax=Paludihabitans sp. MB14-C6 TaxID=3070656 RepID=UPI0027DC117E|nr:NfeD family protein [Paludicola sp. MB14-C6]WMJ21888.1 NfeD family protein [Paludicola sp. MB14-C6]